MAWGAAPLVSADPAIMNTRSRGGSKVPLFVRHLTSWIFVESSIISLLGRIRTSSICQHLIQRIRSLSHTIDVSLPLGCIGRVNVPEIDLEGLIQLSKAGAMLWCGTWIAFAKPGRRRYLDSPQRGRKAMSSLEVWRGINLPAIFFFFWHWVLFRT